MLQREFVGFLFIVVLGSILHFTYEASGGFWLVGVFSAMNESVWEHLKLAFWPSLIWTLYLGFGSQSGINNFWVGRALALNSAPILIASGFYAYTAALGHHALIYDLFLFLVAVAIGQALAIFTYRLGKLGAKTTIFAVVIIAIDIFLFSLLGFYPPDLPIFIDPTG